VHGHKAYVQAHQAGLWQITECGVSISSVELDPPSATSDDTAENDIVVSVTVRCRRHRSHLHLESEPMFAAAQSSCSFDLPCGCSSKYDLAMTQGRQIFAWSYDELAVDSIREEPSIARGLSFSECPNCSKTVEAGSGRPLDICQCLGCGTRYCYNCWHRDYITVSCPSCGSTRSIEVGSVGGDSRDGAEHAASPGSESSSDWALPSSEPARQHHDEGRAIPRH
jgi:hypothetical protein